MLELRVANTSDLLRTLFWSSDSEIQPLDPRVGAIFNSMTWAIYVDSRHVGMVSIYNIRGGEAELGIIIEDGEAELGIIIGEKQYWNKGYGAETISLVVTHCFEVLKLSRVHLKVVPGNTRAIKCYEKAGFTKIETFILDGITFIRMEKRKTQ